jgi:hypothetical protein
VSRRDYATNPGNHPTRQPTFFPRIVEIFSVEWLAEVTSRSWCIRKDIQVDWQTDGSLFEAVAKEHDNVTIIYSENANHVLKFEPKPRSQLTPADVMASYSADEVMLDPDSIDTITSWLRSQL